MPSVFLLPAYPGGMKIIAPARLLREARARMQMGQVGNGQSHVPYRSQLLQAVFLPAAGSSRTMVFRIPMTIDVLHPFFMIIAPIEFFTIDPYEVFLGHGR